MTTKERKHLYYLKNREKIRARNRRWHANNTSKVVKWRKKYWKINGQRLAQKRIARKNSQPYLQLEEKLRDCVAKAVRNNYGLKAKKAMALLGCTVAKARAHLEKLFQPGMSWENNSRTGWHIHHKKPVHSFDLFDVAEQRKCFHYKNTAPVWAREHLKHPVHQSA